MSPTSESPLAQAAVPPIPDLPSVGPSAIGLRLPSVDALRGLVMILMALDHTREFFNASAQVFQAEDLSRTTTALFFTRWITHICAPVFSFTAGLGAFFWLHRHDPVILSEVRRSRTQSKACPEPVEGDPLGPTPSGIPERSSPPAAASLPVFLRALRVLRGDLSTPSGALRTPAQLSSFLVRRGLWLMLIDLTVMRFALTFSLLHGIVILNVLWVLGLSMLVLAGLIHIPIRWLAPLSLAVIALHNLTDKISATQFGPYGWIWNLLHQPGVFPVGGALTLVAYPLIPWFAVMALGYCFGPILLRPAPDRRRLLTWLGLASIAAFLTLRAINRYGDPQPWTTQFPGMTFLSFLRCTKYPASLDFLLMTLGPAFLLLAWFDRMPFSRNHPLIVFGRVPFFYFVVHFYLIHLLTFPAALLHYGRAAFLLNPLPSIGGPAELYPPNYGYGLGTTYAMWITAVVLMYPVCRWFADLKSRRKDWWLSYLWPESTTRSGVTSATGTRRHYGVPSQGLRIRGTNRRRKLVQTPAFDSHPANAC